MDLLELLTNMMSLSIVTAGIVWLSKAIITTLLDQKIELFKSEINRDAEQHKILLTKDVEQHKQMLETETIRFSKLHEKRAEIIKDLYAKLWSLEEQMLRLTNPIQAEGGPSKEERAVEAQKVTGEFVRFYRENKIFFKKDVCVLLDSICQTTKDVWHDFVVVPSLEETYLNRRPKNYIRTWTAAWETIKSEIPILRRELEREFRVILGVQKRTEALENTN